jgi:tetratricopeptide (TPR) repeat protein
MVVTRIGTLTANRLLVIVAAPLVQAAEEIGAVGLRQVQPFSMQEEIDAIVESCRQLDEEIELHIEVRVATIDSVGQIIASNRPPLILHFGGHGSRDEDEFALVLEDQFGMARPMYLSEFQQLLRSLPYPPCQLAVLSACHSEGLAQALLDAGVRHVVAINAADTILDAAARSFARRFYPAVLAGNPIIDAFHFAHDAVSTDETLAGIFDERTLRPVNWDEAVKFRLLPENSVDHLKRLDVELVRGGIRGPRWERTNLEPISIDPFVGRQTDLYHVARQIHADRGTRCLSIQGLGGMGKTSLARAAGRWQHERNRWSHGVWFVELRNVSTSDHARNRIAAVVGVDSWLAAETEILVRALQEFQALLILDDLDHLLQSDRAGVTSLLRGLLGCRRLQLLVTSRQSLPGQVLHDVYRLGRLDHARSLIAFQTYAPPRDQWNTGDTGQEDLEALMKFLDGYPFPIRLAATYMKETGCSLSALRQRLEANPRGTLRYPGDQEDRDTSLAATLDLSYRALPPGARDVFPMLALFPTGISEEGGQEILGRSSIDSLEVLYRFSMTEVRQWQPSRRFALPEPARRYAEALAPPDALTRLGSTALKFYFQLSKHATSWLETEEHYYQGRLLMVTEEQNIRRFVDWGLSNEQRDDGVSWAARTTALLAKYWQQTVEVKPSVILETLDKGLVAARRNRDQLAEAQVHQAIGDVHSRREDFEATLRSYRNALALFTELGDDPSTARIHERIADVYLARGRQGEAAENVVSAAALDQLALTSYQAALALYAATGNQLGEARTHEVIGTMLRSTRQLEAATQSFRNALALYTAMGNQGGAARIHEYIGDMQVSAGDEPSALMNLQKALELAEAAGDHGRASRIRDRIVKL